MGHRLGTYAAYVWNLWHPRHQHMDTPLATYAYPVHLRGTIGREAYGAPLPNLWIPRHPTGYHPVPQPGSIGREPMGTPFNYLCALVGERGIHHLPNGVLSLTGQ